MTLQNKNVVITGKLKKMLRYDAYNMIKLEGGMPKDNMNNTIDILVITDEKIGKDTGKIRKARLNNHISIINEDQFYNLIGA